MVDKNTWRNLSTQERMIKVATMYGKCIFALRVLGAKVENTDEFEALLKGGF